MKRKKTTYGIFKYCTAVILLLSLLLLSTACDKKEEGEQGIVSEFSEASNAPQDLPWNPEELDYIDGLFAAMIDIPKLDDYYRYEAPESEHSTTPIIFIPKSTIYDVRIFTINDDWADISDKKIENILFETEKVTPQKPLIADIQFVDLFAVRGISFKDADGNEYFYEISDSAIDGSLIISEFKNGETEESQGGETSIPETSEPDEETPQDSKNHLNFEGTYYLAAMADVEFPDHPQVGKDEPLCFILRSYNDYVNMEKTVIPFYRNTDSFAEAQIKLGAENNFETDYFDDKAWLVTFISIQQGYAEFAVDSVYFEHGALNVDLHYGIPRMNSNAYKSVCIVAAVDKSDIEGVSEYNVNLSERDYNDVANLESFVKEHQTPENISELAVRNSSERLLSVYLVNAVDQIEKRLSSDHLAVRVKQAGLKVWIMDVNGNKLDYVYTNSSGVAAVVVPLGYYRFYFEGNEDYCAAYSLKGLENKDYISNKDTASNTSIFTYSKEYAKLTVYVTDAETGEPIRGVELTGFGEEGEKKTTDKNGVISMDSLLSKYKNSGTWYTFGFSHGDYNDIKEKVHITATEVHIQLSKTKIISFTIRFVDYDTGKSVSNVKVETKRFNLSESKFDVQNTQSNGEIRGVMNASEADDNNNRFSVVYSQKGWGATTGDAVGRYTVVIPVDSDSYEKVIKVRIQGDTISFVSE